MLNAQVEKLSLVRGNVIIVGVDVAKKKNVARFFDTDGFELCKYFKFRNDRAGILSFISKCLNIKEQQGAERIVIGMEPSGHYWEPLAYFLKEYPIVQVLVNPYHVKQSKEMDDNSPDKNDIKDARLIAKLVKDGSFFKTYLPEGVYRDLRNLTSEREQQCAKLNSAKNRLVALLDRYFPEYVKVFKNLLGKTSVFILKIYPFPEDIEKLTEEELTGVIKAASNKRLGSKKAKELKKAAESSVGLTEGLDSARYRIKSCLEEIEFHLKQLEATEQKMSALLSQTGYKLNLLSIPGVGIVTAARFLGEVGDLSRFEHPSQVIKLAGFNLRGSTSGEKQNSKTVITKRGRSRLRCLLYQAALIAAAKNPQLRALYYYFKTRPKNPLKPNQALIAVANKLVRIMFALIKKNEFYNPALALGEIRESQLKVA